MANDPKEQVDQKIANVSRETLTGSPARTVHAEVSHVSREFLVKGPSVYNADVVRETLVDAPDEPTSLERVARQATQAVASERDTQHPDDYRSPIDAAHLSQLEAQAVEPSWPRSPINVAVQTAITSMLRQVPSEQRSPIDLGSHTWLTSVSRVREYNPVSEVAAKTDTSLVAIKRDDTAPISTEDVAAHTSLVTVKRDDPAPIATEDVAAHTSLVTVRRDTPQPLFTDAGQVAQEIAVKRDDAEFPISTSSAAQSVSLAAVERDTPPEQVSDLILGQNVTLVTAHRHTEPLQAAQTSQVQTLAVSVRLDNEFPVSQAIFNFSAEQVAAFKDTPAIEDVKSFTPVAQEFQQVTLWRWTIDPDLVIDPTIGHHLYTAQVQYALGRDTVPPDEVYDPDTGRHAGGLFTLTTQKRPARILINAMVYDLAQAVVVRDDSFPPYSVARVQQVAEAAALGDDTLPDPTIPQSEAAVHQVAEATALGDDTLPDPTIPQSEVKTHQLAEAVVLAGEEMVDPTIPQSDVAVRQLAQAPALGDDSLPDPTIPQSDVLVQTLCEQPAVADPGLYEFENLTASQLHLILQQVVLVDPTLHRMPTRPAGQRPVVTISIS